VGNSDRGANTCNLRYRDQIKLCTFESWYGVNLAKTSANIGPEPTPCSLLSASASGRGSGPASGVWSHGHLVEDPMMAIGFRELLVLLSSLAAPSGSLLDSPEDLPRKEANAPWPLDWPSSSPCGKRD
jgi:hypothetical protein